MNTNSNFELLVDRFDGMLSTAELDRTNSLIAGDAGLAREAAILDLVVSNIREAGVYQEVSAVRQRFTQEKQEQAVPAKVVNFNFSRTVLRVAAAVLLIVFSASTYKYLSVSNSAVYDKYYSSYEMNTSRDRSPVDAVETAYKNKQWQEVISSAATTPSPKSMFLAGVARMELKQFGKAIPLFENVIQKNNQSGDTYFQDESEYYLGMSYLAAGNGEQGAKILAAIKNDPKHLFHMRVSKMNLDLKILKMKN